MNDKVKIADPKGEDRTEAERDRARPAPLPAGSYDTAKLQKDLDHAALAKNDSERSQLVDKAIEKNVDTPYKPQTLGLNPGEKRVKVEDERLGITEERVVFDTEQRDDAEAAQADAVDAKQPAGDPPAGDKGSK